MEYQKLASEVEAILKKLSETAALHLEVFRSKDMAAFTRIDKELELMVGRKERTVGAFRQHDKDHRCEPVTAEDPNSPTK